MTANLVGISMLEIVIALHKNIDYVTPKQNIYGTILQSNFWVFDKEILKFEIEIFETLLLLLLHLILSPEIL